MKFNKNLGGYLLAFGGGAVVGSIALGYFVGLPMLKIMLGEAVQLCPSCNQDPHSAKCRQCLNAVENKVFKQFGFGGYDY